MLVSLFIILAILCTTAFAVWRVWTQKTISKPGVYTIQSTPEWQALVSQRESLESDLTLSEESKQEMRQVWTQTAAVLTEKLKSSTAEGSSISLSQKRMLVMLSLICGMLIYGAVGHWSKSAWAWPEASPMNPMQTSAEPPLPEGAKHPGDMASLEERIKTLKEKLQENPDDVDKWVLLGRSLAVQRDFAGSAEAIREALKRTPGHPDLLADLADTVAMVNGRSLLGEPSELIAEALKNAPTHPKALALAATAAMQRGQKDEALSLWKKLRATYPETSSDVARIDEIIHQINTQGLERLMPSATNSGSSVTPKPDKTKPIASGARVSGTVELEANAKTEVKSRLTPQSVLYVFAKMESGPPMPLAVLRLKPDQLLNDKPIPFTLDDTMAMSPALTLSKAMQVKVEARLAFSGNAIKQDGDMSAVVTGVAVGSKELKLVIQP